MPTTLKCSNCGAFLQEWPDIPESQNYVNRYPCPDYYAELYEELDGGCPSCGRRLPKPADFVNAIQVEVSPNPATLNKSPFVSAFKHNYHKEEAPSP